MTSTPINVLLIADNPDEARFVKEELGRAGSNMIFQLAWVDSLAKGLERLARNGVSAVLLDLSLPDDNGLDALKRVLASAPNLPVIVMTDPADEKIAIRSVQAGAQDYLIKGQVDGRRLAHIIHYAIQRKQVEMQLADALAFTEHILTSSPIGILTYKLTGECISANDYAARLVGTTVEQLKRQNFRELQSWKQSGLYELAEKAITSGELSASDIHIISTFGKEVWFRAQFVTFKSAGQELLLLTIGDISERKQAELALQKAEAKYRSIFENAVMGIYQTTPEGQYISANPALARMFGYDTPEDLIASVTDLNRQFYVEPNRREEFKSKLTENDTISSFESEVYCKDGSTMWVSENARAVRGEDGTLIYYEGTSEDITNRKSAENALRLSEGNLATAQHITHIGSWELDLHNLADLNSNPLRWSDEVFRIFGFEPGEIEVTNENFFRAVHPDDRSRIEIAVTEAIKTSGVYGIDHRIIRPDGTERIVHEQSEIIFNNERRPVRMVGTVQDITEVRRAEQARRDAETRYRLLVERIPAITYIVTNEPPFNTLYISPQVEQILGFTPEEWISTPGIWEQQIHPDDLAWVLAEHKASYEEHRPFVAEYRIFTRDGRVIWLHDETYYIDDGPGVTPFSQGFEFDITERRQAEAALEASERRFRAMIENIEEVIALIDKDGTIRYQSPSVERMLGYSIGEMTGKNAFELLHPDDFPTAMQEFGELIQSPGRSREFTLRYRDKEGGWHWVDVTGTNLLNEPGVQAIVVNYRDVSKRKRAEQEIQQRLVELEALYESGLALSRTHNPESIGAEIIKVLTNRLDWHHAAVRVRSGDFADSDEIKLLAFSHSHEHNGQETANKFHAQTTISHVGQGMSGWVLAHGQAIRSSDLKNDDRYAETFPGMASGLHVPIKIGERTVGCISVESERAQAFDAGDERLLTTLAGQAAIALENAQLIAEIQRRAGELGAMVQVSASLRTTRTSAEMLAVILDQVEKLFGAEGLSLVMYNQITHEFKVELARGIWSEQQGMQDSDTTGIIAEIITSGRPYLNNDISSEKRLAHSDPFGVIRAAACVPLTAREQAIGVLWLGRKTPISEAELRTLISIADTAANAIRRESLHEQTMQQLARLEGLRTIDLAISSSFDVRLTLNIVLEQVVKLLDVDAACVLLMNAKNGQLDFMAGRGFRTRGMESSSLRRGEGYAGQVALERQIVHIDDLISKKEQSSRQELISDEQFVSYFGVPLITKGEVRGILEIFHRSAIKPDMEWLNYLDSLGWQTAIAIDNALMFNDMQRSNFNLALAYEATIEGWSKALDLRDKETEGHTQRVTDMTLKLARTMGVKEEQLVHIRRGALLHDIGKMGVPDNILLKPGPLTGDEWQVMRMHPQFAHDLLAPISYLQQALEIPYCHHEKWDGTGYPNGLKGDLIPLAARIFAVIDVWDAVTSDRPYRPAWSKSRALNYIRENSGTHFDPQVVEMFLNNLFDLREH